MSDNAPRKIYNEAFGCDLPFDDVLFDLLGHCIETLEKGGKTVSMLFKIPCKAVIRGISVNAYYIYAAATEKSERNKGYMRELINKVCGESGTLFILKPASKSLERFYASCGYKAVKATTRHNPDIYISVTEAQEKLAKISPADCDEYTVMYRSDKFDLEDGVSFSQTLE